MKRLTKKISLVIALSLGLGNPAHAGLLDSFSLWFKPTSICGLVKKSDATWFAGIACVATLSYWWCKKSASSACSAKKNDADRKPQRKLIPDNEINDLEMQSKQIGTALQKLEKIVAGDLGNFILHKNLETEILQLSDCLTKLNNTLSALDEGDARIQKFNGDTNDYTHRIKTLSDRFKQRQRAVQSI